MFRNMIRQVQHTEPYSLTGIRGRIINALGEPLDNKGPFQGGSSYCVSGKPINPLQRPPIRERMVFGVTAIDGMLNIGKGQRIGIFAGSGVAGRVLDLHL